MKIVSVKKIETQEEEFNFPFFAVVNDDAEDCIVMFLDKVNGIGIVHEMEEYVGVISEWAPLDYCCGDGKKYWKPYHGKITIEV